MPRPLSIACAVPPESGASEAAALGCESTKQELDATTSTTAPTHFNTDGTSLVYPRAEWIESMLEKQTAILQEQADHHFEVIVRMLGGRNTDNTMPSTSDSVLGFWSPKRSNQEDMPTRRKNISRVSTRDELDILSKEKERLTRRKQAAKAAKDERQDVERLKTPEHAGRINARLMKKIESDSKRCYDIRTVKEIVTGPLDLIMGWIVLINAVVLIIHSEFLGWQADFSLGLAEPPSQSWLAFFDGAEHVFMVIYLTELILRVAALRTSWLVSDIGDIQYLNLCDAAIVVLIAVDLYVFPQLSNVDSNLAVGRMFRLLRITRTLRIIRVMKLFRQLRVLTSTFLASLGALFWSMVILVVFMLLGALILCQTTHDFVTDDQNDFDMRLWVYSRYGSAGRAMYTMFEATNSGGWPNYARPLVSNVSPLFILIWVAYVTIVIFGIIRIIAAMFVKETLTIAQSDALIAVSEKQRARQSILNKLKVVFEEVDTSGKGDISRTELETALEKVVVIDYLSVLDIEIDQVECIFDLIASGLGKDRVNIDEFCRGVMRLRGGARALDVVSMTTDIHILMSQGLELKHRLARLESEFGLDDIGGSDHLHNNGGPDHLPEVPRQDAQGA